MSKGRPSFEPSEEQRVLVEEMSGIGINQEKISALMGISTMTLAKYFRKELDTAATKANAAIAKRLFQKAMDGDVASMIFWLKTRAGWSEKNTLDVTLSTKHEDALDQLDRQGIADTAAVEGRFPALR